MRKHLLFLFVLLGITVTNSLAQTATPPSVGDGTEANPYQIATLDNLYWLTQNSAEWNKHFIQTADLDATSTSSWDSGKGFLPIGDNTIRFSGKYNGKGHIITNLLINRYESSNIGLFGIVDGGIIDSVGLPNLTVNGDRNVGGIIGYLISGSVKNSYTQGTVNSISTQHYGQVGGFVAYNKGTIENCYASVNTSSNKKGVGGLIGINQGSVKNCYATGDVSADYLIGGLIGQNHVPLTNCYSTGKPTGINHVGGLIGYNPGLESVVGCFWDTESSATTYSAGGIGLSSSEMKNMLNYLDANWDLINENTNGTKDTWGINNTNNGGYPFLAWQGYVSDAVPCLPPLSPVNGIFRSTNSNNFVIEGFSKAGYGTAGYVMYINNNDEWSVPQNESTPTVNTDWQNNGQQCVYNGTSNAFSINITGLTNCETYYLKVYAYSNCNGKLYETSGYTKSMLCDNEVPEFSSINNQTRTLNAEETQYIAVNNEFDPTANDNCGISSISNSYNNSSTLNGASFPIGTTTVIWTVTDNVGSTNTTSFDILIKDNTTGINENQQPSIKLYPNPVTRTLTVEMGNNRAQSISVTDLTGRILLVKKNPELTDNIDVSDLNNGVYLINIETKGKVITEKFVKL